ncbi:MAG: PepSY domain-containing protein [Sphingomonadales bacterium]
MMASSAKAAVLYRTIWRWHFYAGLFVIPFIAILSLTGAIYLFKPQIDRWEERGFRNLPIANTVSPVAQVESALTLPGGPHLVHYRVPAAPGDAALVHVGLDDGTMRDVFVSPQGRVVGSLDPEARISETVSRIHGSLLMGKVGDWIVEMAASWAIVMILTGLYLWWPRGRGLAGVVWPRRRALLRDLHAVTGFWVSGLALVLLVSGLPWASVWGNAFRMVRAEMGWVNGAADWKLRGAPAEHADHDHAAMMRLAEQPGGTLRLLPVMVAYARSERLAYPALVTPPGNAMTWTIKSASQNRTLMRSISYDAVSAKEILRTGFAEKHPIDRLVGYGIAWHEGQLFGWINQLVGLLTALALLTLAGTGALMWWRRRPGGALGAPRVPIVPTRIGGVVVIIAVLALFLPMLALSLIAVLIMEVLILRRVPVVRDWLGLRASNG